MKKTTNITKLLLIVSAVFILGGCGTSGTSVKVDDSKVNVKAPGANVDVNGGGNNNANDNMDEVQILNEEGGVEVEAGDVDVKTGNGGTEVNAGGTSVKTDNSGTSVSVPGVDINSYK